MSSEAKIPQGWLIGLAVLALARDVHPWSVFRHLLKWLKEKVIPKKVYGKFKAVFNHRNG